VGRFESSIYNMEKRENNDDATTTTQPGNALSDSKWFGPVAALLILGSVAGNVFFAKRYGTVLERMFLRDSMRKKEAELLSSRTLQKNTEIASNLSRKTLASARTHLSQRKYEFNNEVKNLKAELVEGLKDSPKKSK